VATATYLLTLSGDDAYQQPGGVVSVSQSYLGFTPETGSISYTAFRFRDNVTTPMANLVGSTINSAILYYRAAYTATGTSTTLYTVEDTATPAVFTAGNYLLGIRKRLTLGSVIYSGTITAIDATTFTDSTKTWVSNELENCQVTSGANVATIRTNSQQQGILYSGSPFKPNTPAVNDAYEIIRPLSVPETFSLSWKADGTRYPSLDIKTVIQALVNKYTPTDICIICCNAYAGTGQHRAYQGDIGVAYATYLVIDYTAATPPPTNFTAPLVTAAATAPVPDLTPGSLTIDAPLVTVRAVVAEGGQLPTLTPGSVTATAPLVSVSASVKTPTLTPGSFSFAAPLLSVRGTTAVPTLTPGSLTTTAPVATAGALALLPTLTTGILPSYLQPPVVSVSGTALVPTLTPGPLTATAPLVTAKATALVPTLTPGSLTTTAPLVSARAVTQTPTLTPGSQTTTAPVVSVRAITQTPQLLPQTFTATAPLVTARAQLAGPTLTTSGVTTYTQYRDKEFTINVAQYPSGTQFYLVVWIKTGNSSKPCYAFLYNDTLGQPVGSIADGRWVSTLSTTDTVQCISAELVLTGSAVYSVRFGGASGCIYLCSGADVKIVAG